jgi:uncharacterized protein involved in exopolysaccharide biosynthesis
MKSNRPETTVYENSPLRPQEMLEHPPDSGITWLLWSSRRFLVRLVLWAAVLSVIVSFIIPSRYKSTARVVPGDSSSSSSLIASLLGRAGSAASAGAGFGMDAASLLGVKTPGAFYVDVLRSETVQNAIIDKFDLRTHYRKKYYYDARKKLTQYTDIDEDKKSGVIAISVTDVDRKLAADMVHAYIDQMNQVSANLNTSAAHREREFLEQRLQGAKQDLDRSVLALSDYSSKHSMVDVQSQGKSMMDAAAKLQGEMIARESELKGLQQIYSNDTPRIRSLQASISELRGQLNKIIGNYTPPETVESSPEGSSANPYPALRALPALGYRYADIYRQVKIDETVYGYLRQQYEIARIQEAKELPVVRVMDPGSIAERKTTPVRSLIVIMSVMAAFIIGCVWVVQKHRWDRLADDNPHRMMAAEASGELRSFLNRFRKSPPLRRD